MMPPLRAAGRKTTTIERVVAKVVECGGGELSDLEYPKSLSAAEREEAGKKLAGFPADLAQQLLDELAARVRAKVIKATPLAYLRGLIRRARAGTFTPEGALQIAAHRQRRIEVHAVVRRDDTRRDDYPSAAVDPENPLINKLLGIQGRLQEKKRETG